MDTIIVTCGTSLITKANKADTKKLEELYKLSNKTKDELNESEKKFIYDCSEKARKEISNRLCSVDCSKPLSREVMGYLKEASAELNTVISKYKCIPIKEANLYFLHTDTYIGEMVGNIYRDVFNVNSLPVEKLRADTKEHFLDGINSLYKLKILERTGNGKMIYILSGGFKSWSGYMQSIGMLYADEIFYQFEGKSQQVISIPKLPVGINISDEQKLALRYLNCGVAPEREILDSLSAADYCVVENAGELTDRGKLLFITAKAQGLYDNLQPPLSGKLVFSNQFESDYKELDKKHKTELGEKLDRVALYCETLDMQFNPSSVKFHELTNNGIYTHEIYPFTGDSRRCYLIKSGETYTLKKIGAHL